MTGAMGWRGWRPLGWGAAGAALLAPLVAMQVADDVAWTAFDFAVAGGMLGAVGLGLELAVQKTASAAYRAGAAIALAAGVLIVWTTGAVGIVGSEQHAANLLFLGVLPLALAGAVAARFRPAGMVWAMGAAAVAQALVPVLAWIAWPDARVLILSPEVPGATVVFTGLWLASAWLFRKAEASA